jgi:hypothetical protein
VGVRRGLKLDFIRPGKPTENGHIESFNGRLRDECLNVTAGASEAAPIFNIRIFPGYRDWRLISVAHEAGNLNDLRAVLGNDLAIQAYREEKASFPDGAVIARLSWNYVPSAENNKVFGREQSFVAGSQPDWYLQFMVKDSKKYAATGGGVRVVADSVRARTRCQRRTQPNLHRCGGSSNLAGGDQRA